MIYKSNTKYKMGLREYIYSFFYVKKTCEQCGKRYYINRKDSSEETLYDICSYNCAMNKLSNDCKK